MRSLVSLVALATLLSVSALASSHREAPFLTKNPKVDGTDFYLFNSYENGHRGTLPTEGDVTLIANFQPLQEPGGGPNYFSMDPEALYEIHIDNTGDAVEDITFQFRFRNTLLNDRGVALNVGLPDGGSNALVPIALINAGPIGLPDGGFLSTPGALQGQRETYSIGIVRGARRGSAALPVTKTSGGSDTFEKPYDNIGTKTFPAASYAAYARSFIFPISIPGCAGPARVFVGQRKEGFAVNVGTIFDLINAPASVITDPMLRGAVPNPLASKNITTIALEVPKTCLIQSTTQTVIGGWSTASVRQARVVNPRGGYSNSTREGGAWTQVSRLGMPLVNEVVIGVPDKDRFNASDPKDDLANFAPYVTNPTLPALINVLFAVPAPSVFPRTDLITVFLTGVTGVNSFTGGATAEMQRLNVGIPATPAGMQNNLGALECFQNRSATMGPVLVLPPTNMACDPAGFPNGRRPGDDVVDVSLRVVEGALLPGNDAPGGGLPFHDAVLQDESDFDAFFPYLKTPNSGT